MIATLLDSISGAQLTVVDADRRVVYAWFGSTGVNVYDEDGSEVGYFTIGGAAGKPTPARARWAITRMMAEASEEE